MAAGDVERVENVLVMNACTLGAAPPSSSSSEVDTGAWERVTNPASTNRSSDQIRVPNNTGCRKFNVDCWEVEVNVMWVCWDE